MHPSNTSPMKTPVDLAKLETASLTLLVQAEATDAVKWNNDRIPLSSFSGVFSVSGCVNGTGTWHGCQGGTGGEHVEVSSSSLTWAQRMTIANLIHTILTARHCAVL